MADDILKNRLAAFESYLEDLGVTNVKRTTDNGTTKPADGQYHYHGMRNGVTTHVTFHPGTIPDNTYNILLSDDKNQSGWFGVIIPMTNGEYGLKEKGEKAAKKHAAAPAAAQTPPAAPTQLVNPQVMSNIPAPRQQRPAPSFTSGQYQMHLVRGESRGKLETGTIVITGPGNMILSASTYTSGPWGKGHAPHVENYMFETTGNASKDIRDFWVSKDATQPGLRIANKSFQGLGRDGILIHEDKGVSGTLGCFGIQSGDWNKFQNTWQSIPADCRPDAMHPMSQEEYQVLKAQAVPLSQIPQEMEAALAQYRTGPAVQNVTSNASLPRKQTSSARDFPAP